MNICSYYMEVHHTLVNKKSNEVCEILCIHEDTVKSLKNRLLDKSTVLGLADIFKALGDQTRVQIIFALSMQELCVCDLAALLEMSQSAISHQLRVLRNLRIVKFRKEGKIVYYSIDDNHIVNLFTEGLEHVKHS